MLLGFSWLHAQPLSGTYLITGISDPANREFATIDEAFSALASQGVDLDGVIFRVQESWRTTNSSTGRDAEPNTILLYGYSNPFNAPVTLTFEDLADTVYFVKAPLGFPTSQFIFEFSGSIKYFTLDGARKLILKSTAPSGPFTGLIGFVSSFFFFDLDIDAITIKDVIMHGNGRDDTPVGFYIGGDRFFGGGAVTPNSSIGANVGIIIQGCTIDSVSQPILVDGDRTNTRGIQVLADTLGNRTDDGAWAAADNIGAVHLRGVRDPIVEGCVVHGEASDKHSVAGIRLENCENFTITRNWVYNIQYTPSPGQPQGYGTYGIYIDLPSTFDPSVNNVVSNNMLAGMSGDGYVFSFPRYIPAGIFVEATSGPITNARLALIHNSINLFGTVEFPSFYNGGSAGIVIGNGVEGGVKINGNLIQNTFNAVGFDAAYGLVIATVNPLVFDIDYNQYYLGGSAHLLAYGRIGGLALISFDDWRNSTLLPDAHGRVHLPGPVPFVSLIDLHLDAGISSSALNAGDPNYVGVVDFDGQTRPIGGTKPDVGADELAGTPFCNDPQAPEIVLTPTYPPLAGSNYLWGQQVEIDLDPDPSSPAPIGDLSIVYSLNGGPWTPLQSVSSFPVTITLPSLTPGIYTGNLRIAVRATDSSPCNLPSDISDRPVSINLTDRPGNRVDNAITIDLDETPTGSGIWTATISDSTDGLAISDEYTGLPRAQAARDLFFRIQLPACLDSLDISLCGSTGTLTDSYIHLINATAGDTIDSDNGCSTGSLSRIVAIGTPNANTRNADPSSQPARDSLLLVRGHTLYLVVEGNGSATGKFTVNITGYKRRPSSINVAGVPSGPVCVRSNPITLNATTPGATAYQWLDANGNPIQQATSATYTVNPNAEGRITVSVLAVFNPNNAPSCLTRADSVTSQPVTITVEDTARAQIADANDRPVSNQTLSITAGSNVNLRVRSPQNSGNTYTWKRYNGIPPSGTPATSSGNNLTITNISAGRYTVILEAVRGTGACGTTRDTVYLDVTTGLRTDAGTFSIFPNPNTGAFTIVAPAMDTYHIHVLDVAGRLVAEDTFTGSTHQMRLSLPAGVYQIRLVAGDKAQIGRLIITE